MCVLCSCSSSARALPALRCLQHRNCAAWYCSLLRADVLFSAVRPMAACSSTNGPLLASELLCAISSLPLLSTVLLFSVQALLMCALQKRAGGRCWAALSLSAGSAAG